MPATPQIMRRIAHLDVNCAEDDFSELARWWAPKVNSLLVLLAPSVDESRPVWSWGHYREGSPTLTKDGDPAAQHAFVENAIHGHGSNTLDMGVLLTPREPLHIQLDLWTPPTQPRYAQIQLAVSCGEGMVADVEKNLVELISEFVGTWPDTLFGCISDDATHQALAFDRASRTNGIRARTESSKWLRGYAWATYIREDLVRALGGTQVLIDSGAFFRVEPLANGALAIATTDLESFSGGAVRRVRDTLEPVLPQRPTKFHRRKSHLRIAWDDGRNGPL